jgi:hypothetical protein
MTTGTAVEGMTMNSEKSLLLKSAQRRRRARGVAMVEGALVFPIMAMFMFMFEMAHHAFDAYITTEHVSEERTWSAATAGSFIGDCKDARRDDTSYKPAYFKMTDGTTPAGGDQVGSSPAADSSGTGGANVGGPSGGWFMHHDSALANITVKRGGRDFEKSASAASKVFCNQPWAGGIIDIIKGAFSGSQSAHN